jgi:2-methylcitrate dehydratase PrpD
MTKQLHAGRAAEAGVTAVELARAGFTAPTRVLEAEDGGLLRAVSDEPDPERVCAGLGERFELGRVAVKPYPCCASVHSSIDCALAIRELHSIEPERIERVVVHTARLIDRQCGFPYVGDGGQLEAQMSMRYCVAAALADGEVTLQQFSEARRQDQALRALVERVTVALDPEIDRAYPASWPGRVTVEVQSEPPREHFVSEPLGSPERCTRGMVEAKFVDLTNGILQPEQRSALLGLLDGAVGPDGLGATIDAALGGPTR